MLRAARILGLKGTSLCISGGPWSQTPSLPVLHDDTVLVVVAEIDIGQGTLKNASATDRSVQKNNYTRNSKWLNTNTAYYHFSSH